MHPFEKAFIHPVPTIVIDIERTALSQKQQGIDMHRGFKYSCNVSEKVGIQRDERKKEQSSQNSGYGIGGETDFNEVVGKIVVFLAFDPILHEHADQLNYHTENWDRQHEASEEEMLLGDKPNDNSIFA